MSRVEIYTAKADLYATRVTLPLVQKLVDKVLSGARRRVATRTTDTGNLLRSLRSRVWVRHHYIRGRVGTAVAYARIVHDGSKPHIIRPRRKTGLLFYWPAGVGRPPLTRGRMVCFKGSVHHPGTKANRFLLIPLFLNAAPAGFRVTNVVVGGKG
jgi:hypothetical protein